MTVSVLKTARRRMTSADYRELLAKGVEVDPAEILADLPFVHDAPKGEVVGKVSSDLAVFMLEIHEVGEKLRALNEESRRILAEKASEVFAFLAKNASNKTLIETELNKIELDRDRLNELARLSDLAELMAGQAIYRLKEAVGDWLHRYDVTKDGRIFVLGPVEG